MRPKANPFHFQAAQPSQKQRELSQKLNKFIMQEGGWIISQPDQI